MSALAQERFADVMLPRGGCVVALAEVYIDESYDDEGPPILCVAGYVYRKRKAREFAHGWEKYLKREGLPYFHMSEAAAAVTGNGIFANRPEQALKVETELITRTREATEFGFASTINEDDYAELIAPREGMRSAYATALLSAMMQVRRWAQRANFSGEIAYFFENGHKHQADANAFMSWLFESPRITAQYHYAGHAFLPKRTPGLHPADLLAWQWRLEAKRRLDPNRKHGMRADLKALLRPQDAHMAWTKADLEKVAEGLIEGEDYRAEAIRRFRETGELPPPDRLGETHDFILTQRRHRGVHGW